MSDDIFQVMTAYGDVAALAQGYMNRADGERLLLPLSSACENGAGVRFVVYLSDGTPAFAGAGLCVQVSDQRDTVPPEQRFETLLDTLQFDERSRPVYEYIVAVRSAAYAQPAAVEAVAAEELEPVEYDEDATALVSSPEAAEPSELEAEVFAADEAEAPGRESSPFPSARPPAPVSAPPPYDPEPAPAPSFIPPPIPTGVLTRPARAVHWQPAPPRRPTPRPASGLFRYAKGQLPRPARPPWPDLDPSQRVQPVR